MPRLREGQSRIDRYSAQPAVPCLRAPDKARSLSFPTTTVFVCDGCLVCRIRRTHTHTHTHTTNVTCHYCSTSSTMRQHKCRWPVSSMY